MPESIAALDIGQIAVFVAVADEGGFTAAGRRLGVSGSAVSQAIKRFEQTLRIQLFVRSTRTVVLTEPGRQFLEKVRPALDVISEAIDDAKLSSDTPSGQVRILAPRSAVEQVLKQMLPAFVLKYPKIDVDITITDENVRLPSANFDVALKIGELTSRDVISLPVGPEVRQVVVATPEYLALNGHPAHPRDLILHRCIRWRWSGREHAYAWEFHNGRDWFEVDVQGPLLVTDRQIALQLCLLGVGICMIGQTEATPFLKRGELVSLFDAYCQPFPGWHLCLPRQRHLPIPIQLFVGAVTESFGIGNNNEAARSSHASQP
jgi:DNA-binding transcriptional LysR family regulator